MLVGPAGAGKSTLAREFGLKEQYEHINQDAQGRQHLELFENAIAEQKNIVIDRMNFTKQQRSRYLDLAKANGYSTRIIVLHQPYSVCLERCLKRENHETIKEEAAAKGALNMFFSKYERVEDSEADVVDRFWPDGEKPLAIYSDLDGTLCDVEHRRHYVRREGKKDWNGFFKEMVNDTVNQPVKDVLKRFGADHKIVLCSGRPDNYKRETTSWLSKNEIIYDNLFMRLRNDSRQDDIVKEILLDFEILTRYTVKFCLDDRDQVVRMLRKRGLKVFQVADGDF
jgi:adenylate kinase family enzyme